MRLIGNSKVLRNIFANYIGTAITSFAPLIALPYYLDYLGPKLWGLISFVGLFASLLAILDAGISQAMIKEFAEPTDASESKRNRKADLLLGYERVYWLFAIAVSLLAWLSSDWVVNYWLASNDLSYESTHYAIQAAIFLFLVQLPGSLYRTVLSGLQEQVLLNKLSSFLTLARHGLGIALVISYPFLSIYLIWQCVCALIETAVRGYWAWKAIGLTRAYARWHGADMLRSLKLSVGMGVGVLLGMAVMSLDKFLLSAMLPLEQLGYYGIASSIAFAALRLAHPVHAAVQPRLVELKDNLALARKMNFRLFAISSLLILVGAIGYSELGETALLIWLKNQQTVNAVYPVLSLLLLGSALNVIYNIGYINWVATGQGAKILTVNGVSLLICVVVTPVSIAYLGVVGAAVAWIIINMVGLLMSLGWLTK